MASGFGCRLCWEVALSCLSRPEEKANSCNDEHHARRIAHFAQCTTQAGDERRSPQDNGPQRCSAHRFGDHPRPRL